MLLLSCKRGSSNWQLLRLAVTKSRIINLVWMIFWHFSGIQAGKNEIQNLSNLEEVVPHVEIMFTLVLKINPS